MPSPTWERLPAERKAAIIAAAEAEFAAKGYTRGSLNVVAREAGVAKGSLFQYFDDKLDLFAFLCERASLRIGSSMAKITAELDWPNDYFGSLSQWLTEWVKYFSQNPIDLGLTAAVNLELDTHARIAVRDVVNRHYLAGLRRTVQRGLDCHAIRADADTEAAVALLLLVLPHVALAANLPGLDPLLNLDNDPSGGIERVVAILENALGSRCDGPAST
ncbi:MAG: TetR/AcrR family transcriptional regulator [Acidimicrobiia bacterium]